DRGALRGRGSSFDAALLSPRAAAGPIASRESFLLVTSSATRPAGSPVPRRPRPGTDAETMQRVGGERGSARIVVVREAGLIVVERVRNWIRIGFIQPDVGLSGLPVHVLLDDRVIRYRWRRCGSNGFV